ncbi:hypothetical protein RNS47_13210, partial [Staphylococcus pseudintermedius]
AKIEDKLKVLSDASAKMAERVYAKKASEGQAGQGQAHQEQAQTQAHESAKTDESVVDAEFEEVKDDKK